MKASEIENAADKFISENPLVPHIDHWSFRRGAEMVNERQTYSAEDMKSAIEWFIFNEWHPCGEKWCKVSFRSSTFKTFDELIKLWEESKNE